MNLALLQPPRSYLTSDNVVNMLVFLFPVFILVTKGVGDLILLLLACIGFYHLCKNFRKVVSTKSLGFFSAITVGYFVSLFLSVMLSGKAEELFRFLARDLHFLFAPLIFIAVSKANINWFSLMLGIKIGLVLAGLTVLFQAWGGKFRPSGVMNAGVFANLAVMSVIFLVVYMFLVVKKITPFSLVALLFGLAAVFLPSTRGAMLSGVLLVVMLLLLGVRFFSIRKRMVSTSLLLIIIGAGGISILDDYAAGRISAAYNNFSLWMEGANGNTSTGLRLEMYVSSLKALDAMPFFGYGYRNANPVVAEYAAEGLQRQIAAFNHLHNAYITNLLCNGYLGLISLMALLFGPLIYFWKQLNNQQECTWSACGVLLCIGYASFGMVNILFGDVFMNAFYVFFLSIAFSGCVRSQSV